MSPPRRRHVLCVERPTAAVDNYQKYIDAYKGAGPDLKANLLKLGSGVDAYSNQAATLRSLGDHRRSNEIMDILIGINPFNPGYYLNKAESLRTLGESGSAKSLYEKYIELQGGEDGGSVGLAFARLREIG